MLPVIIIMKVYGAMTEEWGATSRMKLCGATNLTMMEVCSKTGFLRVY